MSWPGASDPPYSNIVGVDPVLSDPENGDFRPAPGSPAAAYGCQTFASSRPGVVTTGGHVRGALLRPVAGLASRGRASIEASGLISDDTFWDADTVRVVGRVTVEDGVTLTIAPGVKVEFADFYDLTVLGRILAVGSADEPIVFTTDEPGSFAPDSTTVGCWNGIRFPWTPSSNAESRVEYCVLEYSKAFGDQAFGGALSLVGFSKLLVRNSAFRSNAATYGGAISCSHQSSPVLAGNLFEGNTAFLGGSCIYALYAYPDVTNATVVGNAVLNDAPFDATGAIHNHISKTRMTGSIVRDNASAYFIPTQLLEAKGYYTTFCNIEDGHEGAGNIDKDALFVGFGGHAYALSPDSPCIDAGDPDTLGLRLPSTDVAGLPRIDGVRVDIGAYEGDAGTGVAGGWLNGSASLSPRPNPFRHRTTMTFIPPVDTLSSVRVYDAGGRLVRRLIDGGIDPAPREVVWDGRDSAGTRVASGVYFLVVEADNRTRVGTKIVLLR
jgi:hypothetical protein